MKKETTEAKMVIIYTRFSPRRNSKDCESCEMQSAVCEQYAASKGYEVVAIFNDPDVSGSDEFREKLWQAISALSRGGVLLVHKRDRLARNVFLSEQLNRAVAAKGAEIEAVSGDIAGTGIEAVLVRQILSSLHEYERKVIGLRTRFSMLQHQKNGRRMSARGACPYGWKPDPDDAERMLPCEQELSVIAEMVALHSVGKNFNQILHWLNENRREVARTGTWNYKCVRKLLLRKQEMEGLK